MNQQRAVLEKLVRAAAEVYRISHRTHDAWSALAAALNEARDVMAQSHPTGPVKLALERIIHNAPGTWQADIARAALRADPDKATWVEIAWGNSSTYPPKGRCVLVQFEALGLDVAAGGGLPATVTVGYLKYAAGDKSCPYFVTPGFERNFVPLPNTSRTTSVFGTTPRLVTHWCDCLGDDFEVPGWENKRMNK